MHNLVKALFNRVVVIALTLFCCVIMLEIGLRLEGRLASNITYGAYVQHGDSYRLAKDMEKVTRWSLRSFLIRTNSLGFRDSATGPVNLRERPYFTFLGDSITFGNGVDYEETFVGVFKAMVKTAGIEVQNLAIGGHHLVDQVEVLKDFVATAPHPPTAVVICLTPGFIYNFDKKSTGVLIKDGYVFDAHSWRLAYVKVILGNVSAAYCFFRDGFRKVQARYFRSPKGDVPPYLKLFANSSQLHDPDTIERLENSLNDLELYCRSVKTELVYVYLPLMSAGGLADLATLAGQSPADFDASYYETLMLNHCRNHEVPFVNLGPVFEKSWQSGTQWMFGEDPHYNATAHKIVAEYLYDFFHATSFLTEGHTR
jgi:hypothetical protein